MKRKGTVIILLLFLMSVFACGSCCVASENGAIQNEFEIEVNLSETQAIETKLDGYTLTIQNLSSRRISGIGIVINIDSEKTTLRFRNALKGFDSLELNLEEYYTSKYLEEHVISIQVLECMNWLELGFYIAFSLICILVIFARIYYPMRDIPVAVACVVLFLILLALPTGFMLGF